MDNPPIYYWKRVYELIIASAVCVLNVYGTNLIVDRIMITHIFKEQEYLEWLFLRDYSLVQIILINPRSLDPIYLIGQCYKTFTRRNSFFNVES